MADAKNEKYLQLIARAWRERRLVLFLGAGVSVSRGVPSWNDLVIDLMVENTERIAQLWSNYRRAVADWLLEDLDFTPLTLTRAVKQRFRGERGWTDDAQRRYLQAIQKALYERITTPAGDDTLRGAVRLIRRSEKAGRHISAVITTNFDDLLERELKVPPRVPYRVADSRARLTAHMKLPILHVHGFIPHERKLRVGQIVFSEDEYHWFSYDMFQWAMVELVHLLRSSTILFIGFGMTDPNIRRLLDATRDPRGRVRHVVIRRDVLGGDATERAAKAIGERAAQYDPKAVKTTRQLARDVVAAVRQAKEFDEEVLRRLGVGEISVRSFDDIPPLLDRIGAQA